MTSLPNRKTIRLQDYDYSLPAHYFVTIVVNERLNLFGNIEHGEMMLNDAGQAIQQAVAQMATDDDTIDTPHYVVMPNHLHLIVTLKGQHDLRDVIRHFKGVTTHRYAEGVTTRQWTPYHRKLWQRSYYEHIIRNQRAYDFIASYIYNNPARWNQDAINSAHSPDTDHIMAHVLSLS